MTQERQRLPHTRKSTTHKFTIYTKPVEMVCPECGKRTVLEETNTVEVYITVGLFENDRPGEVFIKLKHYGDSIKGFADQWAIVVSIALQHGVPLEVICSKGVHSRFEPSGYTDEIIYDSNGKPVGRVNATSVIDYVCRWMLKTFSKEEQG